MKRWTLAIDTATPRAFAALVETDGVDGAPTRSGASHSISSVSLNSHHEELATLVAALLQNAGVAFTEVSRVLIGSGPGSFTGLRIGYSFARGCALSLGVPMIGVSSLMGGAWEFRRESSALVVAHDAGRGEVFAGAYRSEHQRLHVASAPRIVVRGELEEFARESFGDLPVCFVGLGGDWGPSVRTPQAMAEGLVGCWSIDRRGEGAAIDIAPEYLRAVAAKTIAERRSEPPHRLEESPVSLGKPPR